MPIYIERSVVNSIKHHNHKSALYHYLLYEHLHYRQEGHTP